MRKVELQKLADVVRAMAMREQDMSIGDRANYLAHAMAHVRALGALDLVEFLRAHGAELYLSEEGMEKLGLKQDVGDVAA
ncbi:MAG: hypothetical protein RML84_09180 [Anaerolineae bacterium]|nr:hypothetical protein [Anaerolineae bacterium]